jgi:WD40 repeat protein
VAFSPDGKTLAVGTGNWQEKKNGILRLYDTGTGQMIKEFAGSDGYIFHLQFLKDGRHLLANNAGAGCSIWDIESGKMTEIYRKEQDTRWVETSRDEKQIITTVSLGTVQIWNRNESQPRVNFKASDKFVHVATFSPDGKQIIVGAEDGTLSIWQNEPGKQTQVVESTAAAPE